MKTTDSSPPGPSRRRRPVWLSVLVIWAPGILLVAAGFGVAISFIEPAPPGVLRIAAGPPDAAYTRAAEGYGPVFAEAGITLEVVHTNGSAENLALLDAGEVDVAIVQGGVPAKDPAVLQGVAALYLEPIMVFHRSDPSIDALSALTGARLAVGPVGSGTRFVALEILETAGLKGRVTTVDIGGEAAITALKAGQVDALFMVTAPEQERVGRLLTDPTIHMLSMRRTLAFSRRLTHLMPVVLPQGAVDLPADLPTGDVSLLSATAALVARADLHDAVPPLLVEAAKAVHSGGSLLAPPGEFPALEPLDYTVSRETRHTFENGRSFLYRVLPFWAASLVDRLKILLLPLLTLLIPLFRVAPPLYRWRIRSRIYRWYKALRRLDGELLTTDGPPPPDALDRIHRMRLEIAEIEVPVSYMDELYHLRLHAELVQRRLEERLTDGAG